MAQQEQNLAKKAYVDETFQPLLTAGTGISINPVTHEISSTGGGTLVTYSGNPNISQGDSLGVLSIDGTPHTIMAPGLVQGSNVTITTDISTGQKTISATGGTTVTPNPQTSPTGILTSIGIGNTVYAIQGGAYYGVEEPSAQLGLDGDIYIKYTPATYSSFDYLKFEISKTKGDNTTQLSEIKILDENSNAFDWTGTTVTSNWSSFGGGEVPSNLIDGSVGTKMCAIGTQAIEVYFELDSSIDMTIYNNWEWYTANDSTSRDPVSFALYGSNDGETWEELDSVQDAAITNNRQVKAYEKELTIEPGAPDKIDAMYVKINGEWLEAELGGGGGGSDVEPNPSGTPTDTLSTIRIGQTIYDIEGGGSGGGGFTHEIIRQTNVYITDNKTITLSLEEKYTTPYVVALNVLPLSAWGGLVVQKDSTTAVYDKTNNTLTFDVYTNASQNYNIDWFVFEGTKESGGGGGNANIIELTQAEYDALTPAEKENGTLYMVEQPTSEWTFGNSHQGTSFEYTTFPIENNCIGVVTSLNNVCYAGFIYNVDTTATRVMTEDELTEIATDLEMTVTYATTQTLGGTGNNPNLHWVYGQHNDTLYLTVTDNTAGNKCGYSGCVSSLYYRTNGYRTIYYDDKIWSNGTINGGGSSVIPNPTDPATDTLSTIEIDGTIYNIASSGGGGGFESYLKDGNIGGGSSASDYPIVNLDKNMTDGIYLATVKDSNGGYGYTIFEWSGTSKSMTITGVTFTLNESTVQATYYQGNWRDIFINILKFATGGGSSGGTGKHDVLYTAESTSAPSSITLSKSLTDYDYITTHIKTASQSAATIGYIYTIEALTTGDIIGGELAAGSGWIWYSYTNATTLTYVGANNGYFIQEITGIKIGGGETNVEANPIDTPTDTLETIKIGDTVYDIAGGGGGHSDIPLEMVINQWNQDSNMHSTVVDNSVQTTWNGGSNIGANFAFVTPVYLVGSREPTKITYNVVTTTCWGNASTAQYPRWNYTVGLCTTPWIGLSDGYNSIPYLIKNEYPNSNTTYEDEEIDLSDIQDDYTTLYLVVSCTGWNAEISDIVLVGGGAGSTPALNDLTNVELTTPTDGQVLTYDATNDIWINADGGGSSYTETILYNGQGGIAPATLTLNDDYTNYDILYFCLLRNADSRWYKYSYPYLVSDLAIGNSFQLVSYSEYASYDITDTTTFTRVNVNGMYVDKVIGVKFGQSSKGSVGKFEKLAEYSGAGVGYAAGDVITLSKSMTNYDVLMFTSVYTSGTEGFSNAIVAVDDFKTKCTTRFYFDYNPAAYGDVLYTSDTSITVLRNGGAYTYAVYGIKFGGGGSGENIDYSTTEQKIGKWVDGNNLYQISIAHSQTLGNGWNALTNINPNTLLNIDKLIDVELHGELQEGFNYESFVKPSFCHCGANKSSLNVWFPTTYSLKTDYITIKYTKT